MWHKMPGGDPAHFPNSEVELKPGGLHIMQIGLKRDLAKDEMIDLTLNFSDGSSEKLDIQVMDVMAGMGNMKMQHDHDMNKNMSAE